MGKIERKREREKERDECYLTRAGIGRCAGKNRCRLPYPIVGASAAAGAIAAAASLLLSAELLDTMSEAPKLENLCCQITLPYEMASYRL